jgi:integrase
MSELIEHHVKWCRAAGMSPRTIRDRRRVLQQADRELPFGLEQVDPRELEQWLGNEQWVNQTRRTYHSHLSGLYAWASAGMDPLLNFNPMDGIPRPRRPRYTSRHVPYEVLNEVIQRAVDPYCTFVLLAAAGGLRCCEIAGLNRSDITKEKIIIREAKGGDEEEVFCHPAIWDRTRGLPEGLVAELVGGVADAKKISDNTASYLKHNLKIPITLHQFRHTFATQLRNSGHDLFAVQRLMRHKSIQSTQIYVHVGNEELHSAVTKLPIPTAAPR